MKLEEIRACAKQLALLLSHGWTRLVRGACAEHGRAFDV